jgi:hypothetical protein
MKQLELTDLLPTPAWQRVRTPWRQALIAHKAPRRVALGPRVTLVFEDRETVRWQVQEMARVERLTSVADLQRELDIYNELVPGDDELSATLHIEITDLAEIRPELDRLIGLDEHVELLVGSGTNTHCIPAHFDPKQLEEERIAAVQYIRFALGSEVSERLRDSGTPVALRIDHPHYQAETVLGDATRASLRADLAGGLEPLLDLADARAGEEVAPGPPALRLVIPADPIAPGHVVVEAEPPISYLQAPPALLTDLALMAREAARELSARHGGCRLEADLAGPVRWHLIPTRD